MTPTTGYDYLSKLSDFNRIVFREFKDKIEELDISESNRQWSDDMCLIRYLCARDFHIPQSLELIQETYTWRDFIKPHKIARKDVQHVLDIKSMYRNGVDKLGRPIIYVKPSYNPYSVEDRLNSLIYTVEEATNSMNSLETGIEKMCWILDFEAESKVKKKSEDGLTVAKRTIHILQNHYPERLGVALVLNAPWYIKLFWKVVSVFMATNTQSKFIFLSGSKESITEQLLERINPEQLEECYGGTRSVEPDEDTLELKRSSKMKRSKSKTPNEP